jgi:hypothetical protein
MRHVIRLELAAVLALAVGGQAHAQIVNGSFETGDFGGWVTVDLAVPFFPLMVGPAGVSPGFGFFSSAPTDGMFAALNGWDGDGPAGPPDAIQIAQDLVLPAGAAEVRFDYRAAWDTTFGATVPREFRVDIEPSGGGPFMQRDVLLMAPPGTSMPDTGDLLGVVDVSAFGGDPVRLSFEFTVPEAFTGPAFFQLDNVHLIEIPVANRTLIIQQGACPTPFNPGSNGVTQMVLVGDVDFDAGDVVLCSLELSRCDGIGGTLTPNFGPSGPGPQILDLNHPNDDEVGCESGQVPCACNEDQSSDGIDDLRISFSTSAMASALMLGGEPAGSVITLFLTGELTDGTQFIAGDCVEIVGSPAAPAVLIVDASGSVVWVDVTPEDESFGGGGFTSFLRVYPQGTILELSAPETSNGSVFTGWVVNGNLRPYPSPTTVLVVNQELTTIVAQYQQIAHGVSGHHAGALD